MIKLILGKSEIKLKELADNSVDSIVTDPPYELGFMGKSWDNTGIAYSVELWKECLRVLKPGGYLLSFGGTRTYHRMACAIEDAGFYVRDSIMWHYGSGFPKSMNIGKKIDKQGGENLNWFIDYILKIADEKGISRKELTMLFPSKNGNPTGWLWNKQKTQGITLEQYSKIKDFLNLPFKDISEAEREVIGRGKAGLTAGTIANFVGEKEFDITTAKTEEAKQWEGWGTALKPATEIICMARKPLSEKTVAQNVLKWGTGGINIDGCRVNTEDDLNGGTYAKNGTPRDQMWGEEAGNSWRRNNDMEYKQPQGRFPANVILDDSDEVFDSFPDAKGQQGDLIDHKREIESPNGIYGKQPPRYDAYKREETNTSAARFFYCAKTSQAERNLGCENIESKQMDLSRKEGNVGGDNPRNRRVQRRKNNHPTVKPLSLMRYLCRLITPPKGIVLDPFMGSGSTGIGAKVEGFSFIGIDSKEDYYKIAEARINAWEEEKFKMKSVESTPIKISKTTNTETKQKTIF